MAKATKDRLREVSVGASKQFRREPFEIGGEKFEIVELTLRQSEAIRKKYLKDSGKLTPSGRSLFDPDLLELQVRTIIASLCVPGTDERVLDDTDFDGLASMPASGWVSSAWAICRKLAGDDPQAGNASAPISDGSESSPLPSASESVTCE